MRSIISRSIALTLAVSALVPAVLSSQTRPAPRPRAATAPAPAAGRTMPQPDRGDRQQGPGAQGRAPRGGGGHPAALLLRARQALELTDEQVTRLEALQAAPQPKSSAPDLMRARADLMEAMQGDGNLAGARAALDKMSRARNEALVARLKVRQDVRSVLTPAQKTKVDNMRRALRGRMGAARAGRMGKGGMRQGGMRQGGMRQGGMRQGGMRQGGGRGGMRRGGRMGPDMMPGVMPGMMPGGPQGGAMPRMRRGDEPGQPPVPPGN